MGTVYLTSLNCQQRFPSRRWCLHFTLDTQNLRKSSLLVAGQEVLTADNVGLKLSVLVTYQVTDRAKAAHERRELAGRQRRSGLLNRSARGSTVATHQS